MDLEVPFLSLFSDKPGIQRVWRPQAVDPFCRFPGKETSPQKKRRCLMCSLFTLWAFGKRHLMLKPDRLWILKTGNQQPANYLNIEHFLQSTPSSWFRPMAQLSQGPKQICDTITVGRKSGVVLSSSEFYNPVRYQIHYTDLYNLKWKNNDNIIGIIPYFIKTKSYILLTPTWGASLYE